MWREGHVDNQAVATMSLHHGFSGFARPSP